MKRISVFCLILCLLSSGCDLFVPRKKPVRTKPVKPEVKSIAIADKILRPQPYELKIVKDPFKPVAEQGSFSLPSQVSSEKEVLEAKLMGIVRIGDARCALIRTPDKTKTYKTGESIGPWKIESIEAKNVVLKKGEDEMVLQVGGKDEK